MLKLWKTEKTLLCHKGVLLWPDTTAGVSAYHVLRYMIGFEAKASNLKGFEAKVKVNRVLMLVDAVIHHVFLFGVILRTIPLLCAISAFDPSWRFQNPWILTEGTLDASPLNFKDTPTAWGKTRQGERRLQTLGRRQHDPSRAAVPWKGTTGCCWSQTRPNVLFWGICENTSMDRLWQWHYTVYTLCICVIV